MPVGRSATRSDLETQSATDTSSRRRGAFDRTEACSSETEPSVASCHQASTLTPHNT